MFQERSKWNYLKPKDGRNFHLFLKSCPFVPALQFQSSFRCLTLMLFCFSSRVVVSCFYQEKKKCCAISWFISWGMLKGVNDFCYSDNLHMKSFVPKWDIYCLKKGTPTQAEWLTAKTWKQIVVVLFKGMLITCVLGNTFTAWILHISTIPDDYECKVFFLKWMYSILE